MYNPSSNFLVAETSKQKLPIKRIKIKKINCEYYLKYL